MAPLNVFACYVVCAYLHGMLVCGENWLALVLCSSLWMDSLYVFARVYFYYMRAAGGGVCLCDDFVCVLLIIYR